MADENLMTNRQFAQKDDLFTRCCEKANAKPTVRQASKFRMKRGRAFAAKAELDRLESQES